ncbi:MAG: CvpA family protein [Gemmatimonadetes bacterium]|nr:CvpA family protein [Gemmatimonadota bacterium]
MTRDLDGNRMIAVDYILIAVILISVIFGAIRGFLREAIALLSWLVGLWIAWRYSGLLEPYLGGALTDTDLQSWVARGILLLAVVIAGWLLASLLSYLVQRSGLSLGLDRMLGSVFGLVRGAVIAGFAVMLGQAAKLQSEPWWQKSTLMPAAAEMAGVLRSYVETGKAIVEDATKGT